MQIHVQYAALKMNDASLHNIQHNACMYNTIVHTTLTLFLSDLDFFSVGVADRSPVEAVDVGVAAAVLLSVVLDCRHIYNAHASRHTHHEKGTQTLHKEHRGW